MSRFIKNDPDELAEYLASIGRGLVVFDGWSTAGKSPLAQEMAKRLSCCSVVDENYPKATDDDFADTKGQLRIDIMRREIDDGGSLVLLPVKCARQVLEQLQRPPAAVVWVQRAWLSEFDKMCRDFFKHDYGANLPLGPEVVHEIERYIAKYNAKRCADVIYLNAWGDRDS
jgi:hypothetical protein